MLWKLGTSKRMKLDCTSYIIHTTVFRMDYRSKCKTWNNKLLEGNKGNKLPTAGVDKDVLLIWHQNQRQQEQNKQSKTEVLLHSNENYQQNQKATDWIGENNPKSYVWKWANHQSIQRTHTT